MTAPEGTRAPEVRGARNRGLVFDGRFRVAVVLFGGMVALQSSPVFDATKIAYLVLVVICLAGASGAAWSARRSPEFSVALPWIAVSTAVTALIVLSLLVAWGNGTTLADWARDVAAYALFAAAPIFALDGRASASRKQLVGMLVVAGLLGGLSVAIEWLGRRDILALPFTRLVFPSGQLAGMLYLFAMATALTSGRWSARWPLLAGVILGLFLLTGTRSSLLLLIGPLAMAVVVGRARIPSTVRILVSHGVVALAVVLAFQVAVTPPALQRPGQPSGQPSTSGSPSTQEPSVLGDRYGSILTLLGNLASDDSIKERIAQYEAAWSLFVSSPLVGSGPGHSINWVDISGYQRKGYTADTPLVMPAKFGLLGILVFLGAAVAYGSSGRTALRRDRRSVIALTLLGYAIWTVVSLPLGFPIGDKGMSLALILLLALALGDSGVHLPMDATTGPELRKAGAVQSPRPS